MYPVPVPTSYPDANMISELKCIFKLNEKFLVEVGFGV